MTHLDAAATAAGVEVEQPGAVIGDAGKPVWPRDQWCQQWLALHAAAGGFVGSAALKSVPNRPGAMDAAGAIYDTAAETPMLRFLIEKKSRWLERATLIGLFYLPLGRELREERAARMAKPVNAGGGGANERDLARHAQGGAA